MLILGVLLIVNMGAVTHPKVIINKEASVAEILEKLGDTPIPHKPDVTLPGVSIENGKSIVFTGYSYDASGHKSKVQSRHFKCTACHNVVREDPDLSISDPEARLAYAQKNNIPFLQATTFYGIANRLHFYNDDYKNKYGDLVDKARNDLREATHLCAVVCSQGRDLEGWEIESVLAYFGSIDLKLKDLDLTTKEYEAVNVALEQPDKALGAIQLLKSHYLDASPANFIDPPADRKKGYELQGDPENGKVIYELSCLHCHDKGKYSFFKLDDSKYSFKLLNKNISKYTRYSLYQVGRYGTYPLNGKRGYMPHYTKEKMSKQQMEDLRAYFEKMVK